MCEQQKLVRQGQCGWSVLEDGRVVVKREEMERQASIMQDQVGPEAGTEEFIPLESSGTGTE